MTALRVALIVLGVAGFAAADTPGNCTYEDIRGVWKFSIGKRGQSKDVDCSSLGQVSSTTTLDFSYPDEAVDEFGNLGFWTMVYNQGFEVVIHGRKYFAFSKYEGKGENATSYCDQTMVGWSHDVLGHDWACYQGQKVGSKVSPRHYDSVTKRHSRKQNSERGSLLNGYQNIFAQQNTRNIFIRDIPSMGRYDAFKVAELKAELRKRNARVTGKEKDLIKSHGDRLYEHNPAFIQNINTVQNTWKAVHYPEYEQMTIEGMIRRAGGRKSVIHNKPGPAPVSEETKKKVAALPAEFDWRNVNGVNFVSPVRNQAQCGSCFAFASMAMNECRLRVMTNNTVQVTLSPQDIVDCSHYSQGCDGGFPYLIAGKYAEDYGLVEESCNPYQGHDLGQCKTSPDCQRHYATNYRYIGGYYGASNEEEMMISLVNNGPLVIGFEVYPDLQAYKGGIYVHTGLVDGFNPFELTNHAVLLVGYGVDAPSGMKYWSIKNSWGPTWGEQGYFRILRGVDECAVESCTVESFPVY